MGDTVGGPIYIGGDKAADEFVQDHAVTMDGTQVIESARHITALVNCFKIQRLVSGIFE